MEDKEVKPINQLPEAPASASVKIKSPNGFEYIFTMRDEKASNLLFKMKAMEDHFLKGGYTALSQNTSKFPPKKEKEYAEGKFCPQDGGRLVISEKKDGSKFLKCENNKWNPTTRQSYGCSYIEWPNSNSQQVERVKEENIDYNDF